MEQVSSAQAPAGMGLAHPVLQGSSLMSNINLSLHTPLSLSLHTPGGSMPALFALRAQPLGRKAPGLPHPEMTGRR